MAGPKKPYYAGWRKDTGKGGWTAKGGWLSNAERQKRKEQSEKDRRLHRQKMAQASTGKGSKPPSNRQVNRIRGPKGAPESEFQRHLNHICRGLPAPVPTRVEVFTFRARIKLQTGSKQPCILLHPSTSITAGLIIGSERTTSVAPHARRSGETDHPEGFANWVDSEMTYDPLGQLGTPGTPQSIYGSDWEGEAIGHPNVMVSGEGRPLGALMRVSITAGPTARGYMAHSCPGASFTVSSMREGHATNARVPRLELQHGASRDFYAPLMAPHNVEKFAQVNDRFHWDAEDPYGGLLLTLHEVDWATTYDTPPILDVTIIHAVECRLDLEDRHLRTSHGETTKDNKTAVQGSDASYGAVSGPRKKGSPKPIK